MPFISAEKLTLHYPVLASKRSRMSGSGGRVKTHADGRRKSIIALKNVSFDIKAGQRVGIIGRNGSGKSTLLRVLGGIYEPTAGALSMEGRISALFNISLGLRGESTGRENITLRGLVKGLSYKEIAEKAEEIIAFAELENFIDMPLRTYSSGMAMRLSFAIATAFSPEILLLDEWIGAGDAEFREKAQKRMHSLVSQSGITVIASHNRDLLRAVCDYGLWLDQGVMRAFRPIDEVYDLYDAANAKN